MTGDATIGGKPPLYNQQTTRSNSPEKADSQPPPATAAAAGDEDSVHISDAARAKAEEAKQAVEQANNAANAAKTDGQYGTQAERRSESERLDAILADLRSKFSEQEAMSRFNEIMREEGYEVQELIDDPTKANAHNSSVASKGRFILGHANSVDLVARKFAAMNGSAYAGPSSSPYSWNPNNSSSLQTYTNYYVEKNRNGATESTATWAVYNAYKAENYDSVFENWRNRNGEALTDESGFDAQAVADGMKTNADGRFAAESVSKALAEMLASAGIGLGANEELVIHLRTSEEDGGFIGLNCGGVFDSDGARQRIQDILDLAVKENPGFLAAFVDEYESVDLYDLDGFKRDFNNGTQSVSFNQSRSFVLSGKEPTAVVMGSTLNLQTHGYVYQKKISDSLDYGADNFLTTAGDRTGELTPLGAFQAGVADRGRELYQEFLSRRS